MGDKKKPMTYEEKVAEEKKRSGIGNGAEKDNKIRDAVPTIEESLKGTGTNEVENSIKKVAEAKATSDYSKVNEEDLDNASTSAEEREKLAKEKQEVNEKNNRPSYSEGEYAEAYKKLKGKKLDHVDTASGMRGQAVNSMNKAADVISQATDEELIGYMSDIQNDITSSDLTTEEGRQNIEDYLKQMDEVVTNTDAYKRWTKDYKNAQALSALSAGIGAAFGVPAIDFTNKPSIQQAKKAVDEAYAYLNDIKKQMQTRQQELRDTTKQKALTKIQAKGEAAKKIAESDMNAYNTARAADIMTNENLEGMKALDLYTLNKGEDINRKLSAADVDRTRYMTFGQAGRIGAQNAVSELPGAALKTGSALIGSIF